MPPIGARELLISIVALLIFFSSFIVYTSQASQSQYWEIFWKTFNSYCRISWSQGSSNQLCACVAQVQHFQMQYCIFLSADDSHVLYCLLCTQ
jgi:hypothetical protein